VGDGDAKSADGGASGQNVWKMRDPIVGARHWFLSGDSSAVDRVSAPAASGVSTRHALHSARLKILGATSPVWVRSPGTNVFKDLDDTDHTACVVERANRAPIAG
jgi:hypothetical protein